ncbi:hypothetical protein HMPREF2140_08350 [Hoylesella buccalis DNF00985]|nr:hypothetical protein HMPREF2140_08350 [Hoylesella buccalis DNF00985]
MLTLFNRKGVVNIYSAIRALPLKRLLVAKNNHLLFKPNSLKQNRRVMRKWWWKSLFLRARRKVSVLTIRTFGDELYKMGAQAHLP